MKSISRENFFLYAGGIIAGLIIIYSFAVEPAYEKYLENQGKIEQKQVLLNRYKAILKQEDQLKKRVKYIKQEFDKMTTVLLVGAKPSLAASGLQAILEDIIKKARVKITNVRNKKPAKKETFYQIPIEITFESTLRELKDIIYNIENSDKFLLVRDLNIRLVKSGNPEKLKVKLVVDGYAKNTIS